MEIFIDGISQEVQEIIYLFLPVNLNNKEHQSVTRAMSLEFENLKNNKVIYTLITSLFFHKSFNYLLSNVLMTIIILDGF